MGQPQWLDDASNGLPFGNARIAPFLRGQGGEVFTDAADDAVMIIFTGRVFSVWSRHVDWFFLSAVRGISRYHTRSFG